MKNMKIRSLLSLLLLTTATSGFSTVWTVTNSGFTFNPDTLVIQIGDSVEFNIAGIHNSIEVSQMSWNSNDNTPLTGGWSLPFGGGTLLPADLPVGTHYYVCSPHASSGMKGVIIVESTLGLEETTNASAVSVFPNPSNGLFTIGLEPSFVSDNTSLEVFDVAGNLVHQATVMGPRVELDLQDRLPGVYFIRVNAGNAVLVERVVID
jgi:plastocyanin